MKSGELPTCESLKDTIARALPFWNDEIAPKIKAGKRVLIAAHGNSLRGIVKHLEGEAHPQERWETGTSDSPDVFRVFYIGEGFKSGLRLRVEKCFYVVLFPAYTGLL